MTACFRSLPVLNFSPLFNQPEFATNSPTSRRPVMPAIRNHALRAIIALAITTLAATAFAQTTDAPTTNAPKTVKIKPETAEAEVGQRLKLTAMGFDAEGNPVEQKAQYWIALPSDMAAADDSGMVTFFASGALPARAVV